MFCTVTDFTGNKALLYPTKSQFIREFCEDIQDSMRRYRESRKNPVFYYGRFQIKCEVWIFNISISENINVLQCIRHTGKTMTRVCDGKPMFTMPEFRKFLCQEILKGVSDCA